MRTLLGTVDGVVDTQQLNGKTYLVVPVVAVVEGVLHAGNAKYPELALASVFAKIPDSWNGRPVVVDHPQSNDGQAVSASSPDILASDYLGMIMNARRDDKKLRLDAWIDMDVPDGRHKKVKKMLARIAAEEIIEVSIGAYVFAHEAEGTYDGKDYNAVWDVVIPDHLAFLSSQVGACSIADGCGAFRTDSRATFTDHALAVLKQHEDRSMTCKCQQEQPKTPTVEEETKAKQPETEEVTAANSYDVEGVITRICLANGLYENDIRALLVNALKAESRSTYLITFSDDKVIYETYTESNGYTFMQRSYSIDSENKVTLANDGQKVVFQTKVVALTGNIDESNPDETSQDDEAKGETEVEENQNQVSVNRNATVADALKAFEGTSFGSRIEQALALEASVRDGYVERILSSAANKLTKEQLAGMETTVLASIAELAAAKEEEVDPTTAEPAPAAPTNNSGRSGGTVGVKSNKAPEAPKVFTQEYLASKRRDKVA